MNSKCYYLSKFRRKILTNSLFDEKTFDIRRIVYSTKILSTNDTLPGCFVNVGTAAETRTDFLII